MIAHVPRIKREWSRGEGTPFLPMKVEGLWFSREIGADPEAWWEIRWME